MKIIETFVPLMGQSSVVTPASSGLNPCVALSLFLLTAVASAFGQPSITSTNAAAEQVVREIDIGGRTLHLATFGAGQPNVIVEAGLGEPAIESHTWDKVVAAVSKTHQICLYDRAGLGKSEAAENLPRTSNDVVDDLHKLLKAAKISPPYILVGHSFGGFAVRVYAGKYSEEVAGLVLVDSSYPDQWSKMLATLPPESAQESESIRKSRSFLVGEIANPKHNPEQMDLTTSGTQALAAGNLGNKPLVVISHSRTWSIDPGLPREVSNEIERLWQEWQNELCRLSTRNSHTIATKAGHYIQHEEPQLVVDAILRVSREAEP